MGNDTMQQANGQTNCLQKDYCENESSKKEINGMSRFAETFFLERIRSGLHHRYPRAQEA